MSNIYKRLDLISKVTPQPDPSGGEIVISYSDEVEESVISKLAYRLYLISKTTSLPDPSGGEVVVTT